TGGLLLLAALGGAVWLTGSTNLTEVLASPEWEANPAARSLIAALVALGAFTKAAQVPFHAWLPEAMAAATPVSAF
ncbi:proton-conducting transporter membrane subunit, partial [Lactobacillus gasseri]|uniref:proton-conducting transporter transmembrane domain-containing protein n=1 Tax=Lactobacillus gasseri TaxID=1596 RepID=UPI0025506443